MRSIRFGSLGVQIFGIALAAGVGQARASLTTVHAPPSGEASHVSILNHIYGGSFSPTGHSQPSYSNGSVTVNRIDDTTSTGGAGSPLNLVFGGPGLPTTDQVWTDGIAITSVEAKFAAFAQEFGYDSGSGYVKLFDVSQFGPSGYQVSGSGTVDFAHGALWNWVRDGDGERFYSSNNRNVDRLDHMVTYQVTGASSQANETVWLLFWEDLKGPYGNSGSSRHGHQTKKTSDRDFNDLVVQIKATVVPVPQAAVLGALGLGLLGVVRRRFSRA